MASRLPEPIIAITLGDPCGVGAEVTLKALALPSIERLGRFIVIGSGAVLRRVSVKLGLAPTWRPLPAEPLGAIERGVFIDEPAKAAARLAMLGRATAEGGAASAAWIEHATRMALAGHADAVVTAPISKEALKMAGLKWPGHTELIASLCGVAKPVMMMAGRGIRAALVTTHAAIAELPRLITKEAVLETLRVTSHDLRARFGLAKPRLGVCGLNPHAGEKGIFGREELEAILPAIETARAEGIDAQGPLPADTLFVPRHLRRYDAAVAMFHDQATIPVKMAAFDSGVNITLGLPIIRTSPDHGTAYDIAGRGEANPGSMAAAIRAAVRMVRASRRAR